MILIPAIDIKGGRCVRLFQGRLDRVSVYSDNPVEMAVRWKEEGASWLHVVDIDGAVEGRPVNADSICSIIQAFDGHVEVGGGIRDLKTIEAYVEMGAGRVILGTIAQRSPSFVKEACRAFPGVIAVGIDAKDGLVAVEGWRKVTGERAVDLAKKLEDAGVSVIIYTDISRDGTMEGPNLKAISSMVEAISIPVIASGGVSSIEDVRRLASIVGLEGVIIGKALYSGAFTLKEALEALKEKVGGGD